MKWITREKVKVDRVACPWLIKKFVDEKLSGSVDSQKAVDKAGEIARSVKGVKSVKNNLIVK